MQSAMQKAFVAPCAKGSIKQSRSQSVRVSCVHQGKECKNIAAESAKLLSAGLLSAAMIFGAPAADAKVILVQPEVKNFVKDTPASSSSGGSKAAKAPKAKAAPKAALTSESPDFKPLVLPLALVAVAGGAAAWNAIDPGLAEMMVEGGAKDSRTYAGYETNLKNTPFFGGSGSIPSSVPGNNTPAKGGAKKKGKKFF